MDSTKEQLSDVFVKHIGRERGLQDLLELRMREAISSEEKSIILEFKSHRYFN